MCFRLIVSIAIRAIWFAVDIVDNEWLITVRAPPHIPIALFLKGHAFLVVHSSSLIELLRPATTLISVLTGIALNWLRGQVSNLRPS